jgi:hypothetical protein
MNRNIARDKEFIESKDVHKFIRIWYSGAYKGINHRLREYPFEELMTRFRNTLYITKNIIRYAFKYGHTAKAVREKGIKYLYRGLKKELPIQEQYQDNGFLSTTDQKYIATKFAESDGYILKLKTKDLADNVLLIRIDETLDDDCLESEWLFFPGTIFISDSQMKSGYIPALYEMNLEKAEQYLKSKPKVKVQKGGMSSWLFDKNTDAGKLVIFWRAVHDIPAEVINHLEIPKDIEEARQFIGRTVKFKEYHLNNLNEFIPQHRHLCELIENEKILEKKLELTAKIDSYIVWMSLVDPVTNTIEKLHCMIPNGLFYESFDRNREPEVRNAIIDYAKKIPEQCTGIPYKEALKRLRNKKKVDNSC